MFLDLIGVFIIPGKENTVSFIYRCCKTPIFGGYLNLIKLAGKVDSAKIKVRQNFIFNRFSAYSQELRSSHQEECLRVFEILVLRNEYCYGR